MGIFSSIGKFIKKGLKLVGKAASPFLKPLKGLWDNISGKTAAENMAKTQEAQLKAQAEQAKLGAANEVNNVTQFDEGTDSSFAGTDIRRKKRTAGAYASGIGLNI